MSGPPAKVRQIFERVSDALSQTEADLRSYMREHPGFSEVGKRMAAEWEKGRLLSLSAA